MLPRALSRWVLNISKEGDSTYDNHVTELFQQGNRPHSFFINITSKSNPNTCKNYNMQCRHPKSSNFALHWCSRMTMIIDKSFKWQLLHIKLAFNDNFSFFGPPGVIDLYSISVSVTWKQEYLTDEALAEEHDQPLKHRTKRLSLSSFAQVDV